MKYRVAKGYSLLEVLLATLIASLMMIVFTSLVIYSLGTSQWQKAEATAQQNVRIALNLLSKPLRMAGYIGCFHDADQIQNQLSQNSGSGTLADLTHGLEGMEQGGGIWYPSGYPVTLAEIDYASDAVTFRYANPDQRSKSLDHAMASAGAFVDASNDAGDYRFSRGNIVLISDCFGADLFQISNHPGSRNQLAHLAGRMRKGPGNRHSTLSRAYQEQAMVQRIDAHRYYIRRGKSGNLKSLYRQSLAGSGGSQIQEVLEGIENLQLLYGEDLDSDGIVNHYRQADAVTNWKAVVSVRLALLASTLDYSNRNQSTTEIDLLGYRYQPVNKEMRYISVETTVQMRNRQR